MGIPAWNRLTRSREQQEAHELQQENVERECLRICDCAPGDRVTIAGTVRSMTLRPKANVPALEIELYDGSGSVHVVWLGRRRIPGIGPGRRLVVTGRLTQLTGEPILYNPRYELKPLAA
ncbi:MAG: DNA-binding protein [Actinobacteria bacterium]|nr:DNA-binding protein [Actinomycetota bacterium]